MPTYKGKQIISNNKTYTLRDILGSGGNGCVWSAVADGDSQEYALKFLKHDITNKKNEIALKKKSLFAKTAYILMS